MDRLQCDRPPGGDHRRQRRGGCGSGGDERRAGGHGRRRGPGAGDKVRQGVTVPVRTVTGGGPAHPPHVAAG